MKEFFFFVSLSPGFLYDYVELGVDGWIVGTAGVVPTRLPAASFILFIFIYLNPLKPTHSVDLAQLGLNVI